MRDECQGVSAELDDHSGCCDCCPDRQQLDRIGNLFNRFLWNVVTDGKAFPRLVDE